MDVKQKALKLHRDNIGKLCIKSKVSVKTKEDLSIAYTPGVAEPCLEIEKDLNKVWDYTARGNFVAVVTDGTAVLGLGDIGPEAAMPVMEGKAVLFKEFANIDAFPISINSKNPNDIVKAVQLMETSWGGINLEDISAPRCFEIEQKLKETTNIPIFHDDQHGTAIVAIAGLINSLKLARKKMEDVIVVVNGAGSAGVAVTKLLLDLNVGDVILCDSQGTIYSGRVNNMNWMKEELASRTNKKNIKGSLREALKNADVFLGVSVAGAVTKEMVESMTKDPIIFAMANPTPEIYPNEAKNAGALVVGTGRSDFPNQINNVLAFPGVFRGALDVRASDINEKMKIAAAFAIAELVADEELKTDYVIPDVFNKSVAPAVAKAVAIAAIESGIARKIIPIDEIAKTIKS